MTADSQALMKKALLELRQMRSELEAMKRAKTEPIAVIGLGCRFPGDARDPDAFWQLLRDGVDAISEVPKDRWDIDALYDPDPDTPGRIVTRYGGFVDQLHDFDAGFFGIAPREAASLDPQQRLVLEVTWEALEYGGVSPEKLAASQTGVFVGICANDYSRRFSPDAGAEIDSYMATGNARSVAAGRLSYLLGLQGPSLAVDTACSSSLVAVHLACQSLRNGESDLALAGGVNRLLSPEFSINFSRARMLSPDGRCKTFDAAADGFVRGEGCGVVVLKRLSDAVAHGDSIQAIIRGSAINQDGRTSGLTVPNGPSQQSVIRSALANAGVEPREVSYVEAHGTGTPLGDPIEMGALAAVFGADRDSKRPLVVGSVKTNIGHLEGAAGIAGLVKAVLSLQRQEIPPHLHFQQPSPTISWDELPVTIPTEPMPWRPGEGRRIAGVSSFGFSGTNAHVIIEEAPATASAASEMERPLHVLPISAKTEAALNELAGRYVTYFERHPGVPLADVCFTAGSGRAHFEHRLSVLAGSAEEAREKLAGFLAGSADDALQGQSRESGLPKTGFLFTGQGSQYVNMGKELYQTQPTFREALERCDAVLRPYLRQSLMDVLYPKTGTASPLAETRYAQPALFALEYALCELWHSWGVKPAVVMGHSVGEYVAACVAGVFSLEHGLRLIAERSRLMQALPRDGEMVAALVSEERAAAAIQPYAPRVSIAAVNGPQSVVISGPRDAVRAITVALELEGIRTKKLAVSHAFHSPLMEPMLAEFEQAARGVDYSEPRAGFVSSVTGRRASHEPAAADYWVQHVRQPVRFAAGLATLRDQGCDVFVEIGPQPTLLGMGRRCLPDHDGRWLPSLRRGRGDWESILESLAHLYVHGASIDWAGFDKDYTRRKVALPTYPWQRRRHWVDVPDTTRPGVARADGETRHPLLHQRVRSATLQSKQALFESRLSMTGPTFLEHHRVFQKAIVPGAAYLEMALAAGSTVLATDCLTLEDVAIQQALILEGDGTKIVQLLLTPEDAEAYAFEIFSLSAEEEGADPSWRLHISGRIRADDIADRPDREDLNALASRCSEGVSSADYYRGLRGREIDIDPPLQAIEQLWRSAGEAVARVRLPDALVPEAGQCYVHPVLLDACIHLTGAAVPNLGNREAYLPVELKRLRFYRRPDVCLWNHIQMRPEDGGDQQTATADMRFFAADGQAVAELEGLRFRRADRAALLGTVGGDVGDWLYAVEWRAQPHPRGRPHMDYLPSASVIAERVAPHADEWLAEPGLGVHDEVVNELERLSIRFVLRAFDDLGWQPGCGQSFSTQELAEQLGVISQHRSLLSRLLEMLAEEGLLSRVGGQWLVTEAPPAPDDPHARVRELLTKYPSAEAELALFGRCAARLADVLRGECDAVELLFPEGDLGIATKLYQDSPPARALNGLLQRAVDSALSGRPEDAHVQVLEIGAGTGGTTSHLLPRLPAGRTRYVFTDLSTLFTTKAQERFRDYDFVEYGDLDIERDPVAQGFDAEQFDLVIASNVLHATRDVGVAVQHARRLLAPGGLLLLLEGTTRQRWVDLIFGLTEGWWRFADHDLRPSYPLIDADQWIDLLKGTGFQEAVSICPDSDGQGALAQQAVIVAKNAGDGPEELTATSRNWLIFADDGGTGQELAALLQKDGDGCVFVSCGKDYRRVADNRFQVRSACRADFDRLIKDVPDVSTLRGIVHLWNLDAPPAPELTPDALKATSQHGCGSALHLVQALTAAGFAEPPHLWIVTRGAQAVGPDAGVRGLAQAPLWGLGKVVAMECPELGCVRIDLDPVDESADAPLLLEEIRADGSEDQVAFRNGDRYVARLGRVGPIDEAAAGFRADCTYLIVGGLGGLGLLVARWMAEHGARNLVLAGRSGAKGDAKEELKALEEAGVRVLVKRVDVSDAEQTARLIDEIAQSLPPLRGVIHAAGVLDDGILSQQTWERFERVMAPKVEGAWNLHLATQDVPLDFFVLFSSMASLIGSPGQANHAAANAFLDALARYRQQLGLAGLSINWGVWSRVGAAAERRVDERIGLKGLRSIAPPAGLSALGQLLSQPLAQVGVVPVDRPQWPASRFFADLAPAAEASAELSSAFRRRLEAAPRSRRRSLLAEHVREEVARVLGASSAELIDLRHGFFEAGMDSLTSLELRKNLQGSLGSSLPASVAFDYPTVESLVDYLTEEVLPIDFTTEPDDETDREDDRLATMAAKLEELSEQETEALLMERLREL